MTYGLKWKCDTVHYFPRRTRNVLFISENNGRSTKCFFFAYHFLVFLCDRRKKFFCVRNLCWMCKMTLNGLKPKTNRDWNSRKIDLHVREMGQFNLCDCPLQGFFVAAHVDQWANLIFANVLWARSWNWIFCFMTSSSSSLGQFMTPWKQLLVSRKYEFHISIPIHCGKRPVAGSLSLLSADTAKSSFNHSKHAHDPLK